MTKYYNSGLYERTFYIQHTIDFQDNEAAFEDITYNYKLLAEHYENDLEQDDENEQFEQTNQRFWEDLGYCSTYFEPMNFNEAVALECGLTPFSYKGKNMLALSGCGTDLMPILDAYQALVHKTIDRNSRFFSTDKYFEYLVGEDLAKKVLEAIF